MSHGVFRASIANGAREEFAPSLSQIFDAIDVKASTIYSVVEF